MEKPASIIPIVAVKYFKQRRGYTRPEERDISYLWDMRQAAHKINEFILAIPYNFSAMNKKLHYAVERQLMVIGEAAAHVSAEFQALHSEIPYIMCNYLRYVLCYNTPRQ